MDEQERKNYDLLRFYKKNQQEIQMLVEGKRFFGKILKLNWLFDSYLVLELSNEDVIKIYLKDISKNSIFPASLDLDEQERKNIPKSVRIELWKNHFGERYHGKCFICKDPIRKDNFEACHVVSAANGGKDTLNNLRPGCKLCNRSMGTINLNDFKNKYY